jgi:hypothetical protein
LWKTIEHVSYTKLIWDNKQLGKYVKGSKRGKGKSCEENRKETRAAREKKEK